MSSSGKKLVGSLIAGFCLLFSARVFAASNPDKCVNDIDCVATPECGGDVCDYNSGPSCKPAGTGPVGKDGWCTKDSDCKCFAQGAKCNSNLFYCSFTKAPAGGTGGSSGSGTGGSSGSDAGSGTGGKATGADGGTSSGSSSGCALAGGAPGAAGLLSGIGLLALVIRRARRRR